jgi:CelD/BcsL family acetyltransferase involved in cellulose biosynthesis
LNPIFPSYQSSIIPERPGAAKGIPVAANFFILYGKQAYFLKTSYREDYSKYSPGNILMWFSFKHLLEVEHVNIVDYQKDYEKHKIQFGGVINEKRYQMLICNSNMAHIDLKCRDKLAPLVRRVRQEFVACHEKQDKKEMRDIK